GCECNGDAENANIVRARVYLSDFMGASRLVTSCWPECCQHSLLHQSFLQGSASIPRGRPGIQGPGFSVQLCRKGTLDCNTAWLVSLRELMLAHSEYLGQRGHIERGPYFHVPHLSVYEGPHDREFFV